MEQTTLHWYALRVTYCRELKLKDELDALGLESYIPMEQHCQVRDGKRKFKLVPAVHNLLFVHCSPSVLSRILQSSSIPSLRCLYHRSTHLPLVIPDAQMWAFMVVTRQSGDSVVYLDEVDLSQLRGTRVRVIGGIFAGIEGILTRVRHDRRVVVSIDGVMAVATAFIHPSLLEPVEGPSAGEH